MDVGIAYYPEHWPRDRWKEDAEMMAEAGINFVRMGEFAWSWYEPEEGRLSFSQMDEAIDLLARRGIRTMMSTVSRTPPPWVFRKYPGIAVTYRDGQRGVAGHRYDVALCHPTFVELSQRIDGEIIDHFATNPHVFGWHVDNEVGTLGAQGLEGDFSEETLRAFRSWLRQRFGTPQAMNDALGAHFWSWNISDFEDVPLPLAQPQVQPGLSLEWRRFRSAVHVDFVRWRRDRVKARCDAPVTTNYQPFWGLQTNLFDMGEAVDIPGHNYYPDDSQASVMIDLTRGTKGKCMVLEMRTGMPLPFHRGATKPGWIRLWMYQALAHGANSLCYFRWRTCPHGAEQYWHGLLPHHGRPGRLYEELKTALHEVHGLGPQVSRTQVRSHVALVYSYPGRWAMEDSLVPSGFDYRTTLLHWHRALIEQNVSVDVVPPDADLSAYRLVLAPLCYLVTREEAQRWREFVKNGGILFTTYRSAVVDEFNKVYCELLPAHLTDVLGVEVDEYDCFKTPVPVRGSQLSAEAGHWADAIRLGSAESLATYEGSMFEGRSVLTQNKFGEGLSYYLAADLGSDGARQITSMLLEVADVRGACPSCDGVQVQALDCGGQPLLCAVNFSEEQRTIHPDGAWCDLLTEEHGETAMDLPPLGVRLLAPCEAPVSPGSAPLEEALSVTDQEAR